jgi:hypothetical protein
MRKYLVCLLSLLLFAGVAFGASIPSSVNPKEGPEIWLTEVYNNSGSALDAGDVVVWDIASSTGDNDNYVTTTTTKDTALVAGVVYPAGISASASGSIAIRGVVDCDTLTAVDGLGASSFLCTSATAGDGKACTNTNNAYAITTAASSSGSATCYVFVK